MAADRIEQAAQEVRQYHAEHGHWPCLGSDFIEALPLTHDEIGEALRTGRLEVVFPPAGPRAFVMATDAQQTEGKPHG